MNDWIIITMYIIIGLMLCMVSLIVFTVIRYFVLSRIDANILEWVKWDASHARNTAWWYRFETKFTDITMWTTKQYLKKYRPFGTKNGLGDSDVPRP